MSNYQAHGKHPITKEWFVVDMLDDFYGPHEYAVRFPDGTIYRREIVEIETIKPVDTINSTKLDKCKDNICKIDKPVISKMETPEQIAVYEYLRAEKKEDEYDQELKKILEEHQGQYDRLFNKTVNINHLIWIDYITIAIFLSGIIYFIFN